MCRGLRRPTRRLWRLPLVRPWATLANECHGDARKPLMCSRPPSPRQLAGDKHHCSMPLEGSAAHSSQMTISTSPLPHICAQVWRMPRGPDLQQRDVCAHPVCAPRLRLHHLFSVLRVRAPHMAASAEAAPGKRDQSCGGAAPHGRPCTARGAPPPHPPLWAPLAHGTCRVSNRCTGGRCVSPNNGLCSNGNLCGACVNNCGNAAGSVCARYGLSGAQVRGGGLGVGGAGLGSPIACYRPDAQA